MKRRIVIEIPEKVYKKAVDGMLDEIESCYLNGAVVNGTPLPKDATNGDVIKAMFPKAETEFMYDEIFEEDTVWVSLGDSYKQQFSQDWWNAPYKAGE